MGTIWRKLLVVAVGNVCVFSTRCVVAQITPDRTLPNNSNVTINGNVFNIDGGTQAGRNLFHSFQSFSVPTGGKASFNNGLDIQNIFSRVTGGSISTIDGEIKALGTANLFFINPNGIVFGKNASLNIGGSFVATTANALQFGNIGTFSASVPNNPPLLTINPTALLFNQIARSASIQNSSIAPDGVAPIADQTTGLKVPDGNSLLLVGGSINLDGGSIRAYGGHVELAGLGSSGNVGLNVAGNRLGLNVPDNIQRADVSLVDGATINVSSGGGGDIIINAHDLNINGGSQIQAGIASGLGRKNIQAGDININATGTVTINEVSRISNTVDQNASGNAGNIKIQANDISIINKASDPALNAESNGFGHAGNVFLSATGSIFLTGQSVFDNDRVISTFSNAFAHNRGGLGSGDISLQANGVISLDNAYLKASSSGIGDGGNILLQGNKSVTLANNSSLVSAAFFNGNSGNIVVKSLGSISVQNSLVSTGVGFPTSSENRATLGDAGNISISGKSISVTDGAEISSRSFAGGRSGNISLQGTDTIKISGKAPVLPRRQGIDRATSYDNSTVAATSEALARGIAGDISIDTNNLLVSDSGAIRAESRSNAATGRIIVSANTLELFQGGNITTNAINNSVSGGNINVNANLLSIIKNSKISANSANSQGGRVLINTEGFFLSRDSSITAEGANPLLNGTVQINNTEIDPSRGLVVLPIVTTNTPKLVSSNCTAFNETTGGSNFTITGRGGLPPSPYEPLTSDAIWSDTRLPLTTAQQDQPKRYATKIKSKPLKIIPATGWVFNKKGEVTLISSVSNTASNITPTSCPAK